MSEAEDYIQGQLNAMSEALKPFDEELNNIAKSRKDREEKGEALSMRDQSKEDRRAAEIKENKTDIVENYIQGINKLLDDDQKLDKKKVVLQVIEKIPNDIFSDAQAKIADDLQKKISIDDRHAVLDEIKGKLNSPGIIKDAKKVGGPKMADYVDYIINSMSKDMAKIDKGMAKQIKQIESQSRINDKGAPISQSNIEDQITKIKEESLYQKAQLISSTAKSIDREMTEGQEKASKPVNFSKRILRVAAVVGTALVALMNDQPDFSQAVWKVRSTDKRRKESIDIAQKMSEEIKEHLSNSVGVQAGKRIETARAQMPQNNKGKAR